MSSPEDKTEIPTVNTQRASENQKILDWVPEHELEGGWLQAQPRLPEVAEVPDPGEEEKEE